MLTNTYYESLVLLGDSEEIVRARATLLRHVVDHPHIAEQVRDSRIRMFTVKSTGSSAALRLLYSMNDEYVYLLWIERWDESL